MSEYGLPEDEVFPYGRPPMKTAGQLAKERFANNPEYQAAMEVGQSQMRSNDPERRARAWQLRDGNGVDSGPTYEEIGKELGVSAASAFNMVKLKRREETGYPREWLPAKNERLDWSRIVHLHEVEGLGFRRIGRALGIRTSSAYNAYKRAKAHEIKARVRQAELSSGVATDPHGNLIPPG